MNQSHRLRCCSIEQFQHALGHVWDVEITQSDAGPLDIILSAAQVGDCLVYSGSSNRTLLCSGQRSAAFWTVAPITRGSMGSRYRGQQLSGGETLLLDPGGDVYQQVGVGHRQEAVSIPVALVEQILQVEHQVIAVDAWQNWCVKDEPRLTTYLHRLVRQLLSDQGATCKGEGADLASQIVALVQQARQTRLPPSSFAARCRIVRRGEELIRSRLDNPPSVTELCAVTHTSRRLLFYAFQEILGRSPYAHSKVLRLHAARRRILARPNEPCVHQVAYDLGFFHPGQFAIDYAKLFGESPSQTRRGG